MAETNAQATPLPNQPDYGNEYGAGSDEEGGGSPYVFGLNAGKTFLKDFKWIPNGGKDGAEGEALDIIFNINGKDKGKRIFPVTQAFGDNNEVIKDREHAKFKEALADVRNIVTHILHTFVPTEQIQIAMSRKIEGFKHWAEIAASLLPQGYQSIPLDIFMQYQWQPSQGKNVTYLDLPKKMSTGKWLTKAIPGNWIARRPLDPKTGEPIPYTESMTEALWYENEQGQKHLFVKNGWFMLSPFANQMKPKQSPSATRPVAAGTAPTGNAAAQSQAPTTGENAASKW